MLAADMLGRSGVRGARLRARPRARGPRRRELARVRPRLRRSRLQGGGHRAAASRRLGVEERAAFPAVLGHADPHGVWSELEQRLGRPVFEIPTLPPSVPGMRVHRTLHETLRRVGGRVILNTVVIGRRARGAAASARCAPGSGCARSAAERTGLCWPPAGSRPADSSSTRAGGRARRRSACRSAGCPSRGRSASGPGYFDDHPMARAGRVGGRRAASRSTPRGERLYENVLVAGATLAGAEPWREKSGDGLSLSTGYRAAELVLAASEPAGSAAGVVGGLIAMAPPTHTTTCSATSCAGRSTTASSARSARPTARSRTSRRCFPDPSTSGPQAERFRIDDEPSPDASLDYCSGCGICTQVCPQGVHIAEINTQARAN